MESLTCDAYYTVPVALEYRKYLRAIDSKYGESNDSSENSAFLLLHQDDPFGELFSEIYFKSSSELTYKSRKYTGASPLRDLNIIVASCFLLLNDSRSHFKVSRSRLELFSYLACGFAIFAVSHIDRTSIHPKRGHSNRNEVGLKRYIFVPQWTEKLGTNI